MLKRVIIKKNAETEMNFKYQKNKNKTNQKSGHL